MRRLTTNQIRFVAALIIFACGTLSGEPSSKGTSDEGGVVWSWGGNIWAELGHEKGKSWPLYGGRYQPARIRSVGEATDVAAGRFHSLALDVKGSVWSWGNNEDGQLGIGSKSESGAPSRVPQLSGVRAVVAGGRFSVAVMNDGTLRAWGANDAGQLGDGTTQDRTSPVHVRGIADVKAAASGSNFTVALKKDGTVWAWGYNGYGQLGDGTKTDRPMPVKIKGLAHVKAIACGDVMTIALKEDGTIWGCGFNWYGNLGDGTQTDSTSPVQVKNLNEVEAIACGANANHVLAIRRDGTLWTWGYGYKGELGIGERFRGEKYTATKISSLQNIKTAAAGWDYSVAVEADGSLWAWGRNWNGQFGTKEPAESLVPVKISGVGGIVKIACGAHHTIAIRRSVQNGEKRTSLRPMDEKREDSAPAQVPLTR